MQLKKTAVVGERWEWMQQYLDDSPILMSDVVRYAYQTDLLIYSSIIVNRQVVSKGLRCS
jgi:hypothetical protein